MMSGFKKTDAAQSAATEALDSVRECIDKGVPFVLEAGAGAGKTYSLIHVLRYLVAARGEALLRRGQRIACITYTNVARDEIESRTDGHPAVLSSTIHSFCWSLMAGFQPFLRDHLEGIEGWAERLEESGGLGGRPLHYDLGYRSASGKDHVAISHDDVLELFVAILEEPKFRILMASRYPVVFIDEYQDTDVRVATALKTAFLDTGEGPLLGFFGDHWQKIYGSGCGGISHDRLRMIAKNANFRSGTAVVDVLNAMRPELPQFPAHAELRGSAVAYLTNSWVGKRRIGSHWAGDLPAEVAHEHLIHLRCMLEAEGWDFSPDKTKILMLTHNVLAEEQGYRELAGVFKYNDAFLKKDDDHIAFFLDVLEPGCVAYQNHRYGLMLSAFGSLRPTIRSTADKLNWARDMDVLLELRANGTVGNVIDHLRRAKRPQLPDIVEKRERELAQLLEGGGELPSDLETLRKLREIQFQQVTSLGNFVNGHTPFATKHGVKGAEFQNVLVVVGRGWNQYDFGRMLEWAGSDVPADKAAMYERSRNLFYVVSSRPTTNLCLLFTQELSAGAAATLETWFGADSVASLEV
jgi:DNA helicase-2/ATP-dependent DNA helicase PcrA